MSYQCYRCKQKIGARQLVKNGARTCPCCGAPLPQKNVLSIYNQNRRTLYRLRCQKCGRRYRVDLPRGDCEIRCKNCGELLLRLRRATLKGVEIPNYIDAVQESKINLR